MTDSASSPDPEKARPAHRRWLRRARDILFLLIVFAAIQWWQSRDLVAGVAPPLVGHLVEGAPFQLDAAQGPFLVHFWATWCPVCRLEQDSIANIAADRPAITVATTSGDAGELADYLAGQGLQMPVLMDEDGAIARACFFFFFMATTEIYTNAINAPMARDNSAANCHKGAPPRN
ncbi:MAG: redoxin domain-containing protein, partial [Gammaproteobacteria bacterium]|nr:redoxin domain-containing protein [Gammaproteobacteria bacterium]